MEWNILPKPAEYVESQLINAILGGSFPIGAVLPAERELAARLGVTRPTLREALQRLARDGWVDIHQGKPTRVRNFWQEGSLGVLNALAHRPWAAPADFIPNLLRVRLALAPAYIRRAVEHDPSGVNLLLDDAAGLPDESAVKTPHHVPPDECPPPVLEAFAGYDWKLHHGMTILSGNPIFTLIVNGFADIYIPLALRYFISAAARQASRGFYRELSAAARLRDSQAAEDITRAVMLASIEYWQQSNLDG